MMNTNEYFQSLWLFYYVASAVFVLLFSIFCWRWRFAHVRFWLPILVTVIVVVPLPVDHTHQYFAPMIAVWMMSFFS